MAATGYTPILIYASGTATNVPLAANLTSDATRGAELALNYNDGKLYYKDSGGVVQLLASKASATGTVSSVAQSFTGGLISVGGSPITTSGTLALTVAGTSGGLVYFSSASTWASSAVLAANAIMLGGGAGAAPATTTTGTGVVTAIGNSTNAASGLAVLNASGYLAVAQGGTNAAATPTAGAVAYGTGTAYAFTAAGTTNQVLVSNGASAPSWSSLSSIGVTTFSAGTTGFTPSIATSGAITLAGTLITSNGGTGLSSYTAGDITYYASGTALSKLAIGTANQVLTSSGSAPQWSTNLSIGSLTASADSSFTSTGALLISKGTTAQQPGSPVVGMLRYNTTTNQFEGYSGASPAWTSVGGAALSNDTSTASNLYPTFASATSGTALNLYTSNAKLLYKPSTGEFQASVPVASNGIVVNSQTVATSYTIAAGYSGMSSGPVTVASGQSVTIASGSRWVVV